MKPVRLADVAALAGVAKGTVSLVLNGAPQMSKFSQDCIDRIIKAADELGYSPDYHARSLRTRRSYTIGFMLGREAHRSWTPFWDRIIGGLVGGAREKGYAFLLIEIEREDRYPLDTGLRLLRENRVDALVLPQFLNVSSEESTPEADRSRIVLVNHPGESPFVSIGLDPGPGIRDAVRYLAEIGHRTVLYIDQLPRPGRQRPDRRRQIFRQAASQAGLTCRVAAVDHPHGGVPGGDVWQEVLCSAAEAFRREREKHAAITAVFCHNENIAFGVYEQAKADGMSIPGDLSVIGFDDIQGMYAYPAMSCVSHRVDEIGLQAARVAVDLVCGDKKLLRRKKAILVPSTFMNRKSIAPPP